MYDQSLTNIKLQLFIVVLCLVKLLLNGHNRHFYSIGYKFKFDKSGFTRVYL